jgi:predicted nucleotide-binding protein
MDEYYDYRQQMLSKKRFSNADKQRLGELFTTVQRKSGWAAPLIADMTGLSKVHLGSEEVDMWLIALRANFDKLTKSAFEVCLQAINRAIGKLESDIKVGIRDKAGNVIVDDMGVPTKCFISHGKEGRALAEIEKFLRHLGIEPLVVKEQASIDKTVPDKVNYYLEQSDFVVILATGDDKIKSKFQPRPNVIHEIGLAQKTLSGRIIYLLEQTAEFPSNISSKVWERFDQLNLENVFVRIIIELKAFGVLKILPLAKVPKGL